MENAKDNKEELIKFCSEHSDYELCKYAIEHKCNIYVPAKGGVWTCFKLLKEICDKSNGKYKYIDDISRVDAYYGGHACIEIEGERFPYTPCIWWAQTLAEPKVSFSYFMQKPVAILSIDKFIKNAFVFLMCQELVAYSIDS